ncbi:Protein of unknown function [Gryllus bimaculatus]|nr:Protein of unknown function [Gryllus bimaculatus]
MRRVAKKFPLVIFILPGPGASLWGEGQHATEASRCPGLRMRFQLDGCCCQKKNIPKYKTLIRKKEEKDQLKHYTNTKNRYRKLK